jgi:ribosomal protein S18 acetylase RimI-like enzyme
LVFGLVSFLPLIHNSPLSPLLPCTPYSRHTWDTPLFPCSTPCSIPFLTTVGLVLTIVGSINWSVGKGKIREYQIRLDDGYIQTICIREDFRGRGFGTKLLEFCEERILKFSPNVFICVSSFNKGAIKLYHEFGFKLVGELDNFIKEGFTELLLRKTAGPRVGYLPQ